MSTKYIALTTISKTVTPGTRKTATQAGTRPVVKEVVPGTILVIDDADEAKELLALGAIRKPSDEELNGKVPDEINSLSQEQMELSAKDRADLARLRKEEDDRKAAAEAAAAAGGGNGGGSTENVDPVDALTTHAKLDEYYTAKKYEIGGWGVEGGIKTVADKQTALRNADKSAADAAAANLV